MKFTTTLLAVRDMDRSLAFYIDLFDQEVVCDLGWNKTLSCGLTLQLHFDALCEFPAEQMHWFPHNMELYFETEDIDAFVSRLQTHPEAAYLNPLRQHPWRQRLVRIFDPDGHIIEVGEAMERVAFREFAAGHSPEETAGLIQHPLPLVQHWFDNYRKAQAETEQK